MVSIRQWEHSRWRLLKLALIAVWVANNLIQRPLNTQALHLCIRPRFIYHSIPRAKCCPVLDCSKSHTVVRMLTMPWNCVIDRESLCLRGWEQMSCHITAVCMCQGWCFILLIFKPLKESVVNQTGNLGNRTRQTGSQLLHSVFLFTLEQNASSLILYLQRRSLNSKQNASWQTMRKKGCFWQPTHWFMENCSEPKQTLPLNTEGETKVWYGMMWEWRLSLQANGNISCSLFMLNDRSE